MIINEIFYSLQGEGQLAGVASVFVRIAGCPLRCTWCDTKYAWSESAGKDCTAEQVKKEIKTYPSRHIVITGGEPMVQSSLGDFIKGFAENDMHITIETSGIEFIANLRCDLMSISPKLSNAQAQNQQGALNIPVIQKLIDNYNCQLKFVIDRPDDVNEVIQLADKLKNVEVEKIFLMPQAVRREEYIDKAPMVAQLCKETGFTFSPRLHVLLYDGQKGK